MTNFLGAFGSWAFILGGVMLLLFVVVSRRTESRFVRVTQAVVGVSGIAVGVLGLLR